MADRLLLIDDVTGKRKRGGSPASAPTDEDFDVGGGGQANFTIAAVFGALTKIDITVNGMGVREGATHDYQRNVSLNRIEFNYTVPQNAWIRVRLYV